MPWTKQLNPSLQARSHQHPRTKREKESKIIRNQWPECRVSTSILRTLKTRTYLRLNRGKTVNLLWDKFRNHRCLRRMKGLRAWTWRRRSLVGIKGKSKTTVRTEEMIWRNQLEHSSSQSRIRWIFHRVIAQVILMIIWKHWRSASHSNKREITKVSAKTIANTVGSKCPRNIRVSLRLISIERLKVGLCLVKGYSCHRNALNQKTGVCCQSSSSTSMAPWATGTITTNSTTCSVLRLWTRWSSSPTTSDWWRSLATSKSTCSDWSMAWWIWTKINTPSTCTSMLCINLGHLQIGRQKSAQLRTLKRFSLISPNVF